MRPWPRPYPKRSHRIAAAYYRAVMGRHMKAREILGRYIADAMAEVSAWEWDRTATRRPFFEMLKERERK